MVVERVAISGEHIRVARCGDKEQHPQQQSNGEHDACGEMRPECASLARLADPPPIPLVDARLA
jgi:hypothetical protein